MAQKDITWLKQIHKLSQKDAADRNTAFSSLPVQLMPNFSFAPLSLPLSLSLSLSLSLTHTHTRTRTHAHARTYTHQRAQSNPSDLIVCPTTVHNSSNVRRIRQTVFETTKLYLWWCQSTLLHGHGGGKQHKNSTKNKKKNLEKQNRTQKTLSSAVFDIMYSTKMRLTALPTFR